MSDLDNKKGELQRLLDWWWTSLLWPTGAIRRRDLRTDKSDPHSKQDTYGRTKVSHLSYVYQGSELRRLDFPAQVQNIQNVAGLDESSTFRCTWPHLHAIIHEALSDGLLLQRNFRGRHYVVDSLLHGKAVKRNRFSRMQLKSSR